MNYNLHTLRKCTDNILDIQRDEKPKDYFVSRSIIPLGTKRPWYTYKDGIIPHDEIVFLKMDKTNVQNMLTVAPTGVGKSRFRKRIVGYQQKFGYNIIAIDPKSYEYLNGSIIKGTGRRLHQFEENGVYQCKSYVPSFVKKHIYVSKRMLRHFNFYSPKMSSFTDTALWRNLGAADKAASFIVAEILKGNTDLDKISKKIATEKNLMANTKRAAIGAIAILQDLGFFDRKIPELDIKKEWEEGNMIAVSYFAQQGPLMNTDIAKLIQQVRDLGNYELQNGITISPKVIDFDDALYYAIRDRADDFNMAIREIKNSQNNYRSLGINTNITVQNPSFIDPDIIDGCTTKFIWGVENPESLNGLIPRGAYELLKNRMLVEDEGSYTFECIMIQGRRKWTTFFPFDVPYGHS